MPADHQPNLLHVDWSKIPRPKDDGGAVHLTGANMPDVVLPATDGAKVNVGALTGRWVIFFYPRTNRPDEPSLVDDWDQIPGARGCTPQTCAYRDLRDDLRSAGATGVFAVSTQRSNYQAELVTRLQLPFSILSDADLRLTEAMQLPTLTVAGQTLIKRMSMVVDDGRIVAVNYPVFPPDQDAPNVLAWLRANPGG
ncbi:MAG: peroxiredoxin [Pseudomonadota bacterium]